MSFTVLIPKCLQWPFCPGVFIAILAFVAAAVTFRKEPSLREKAIWTFVFLFLMVGEVWMMSKDRDRSDKEHSDDNQSLLLNFQKVGGDIQASIEQSREGFDETMTKAQENLNHMTGGNSYPVVTMVPIPMKGTTNKMRLLLTVEGKNPLFDVEVEVQILPLPTTMDPSEFVTTGTTKGHIAELAAASISGARAVILPIPIEPSLTGQSEYQIVTIARNATFRERLRVRNVGHLTPVKEGLNSDWEQSLEVIRGIGKAERTVLTMPWHPTLLSGAKMAQP